jgi:hypothetical protein
MHSTHLVPHIPELEGGFVFVAAVPSRGASLARPRVSPASEVHAKCESLGFAPDDYRLLGTQGGDAGVALCAFRHHGHATQVATAMHGDVLALPHGYPEMLMRTSMLALAYRYAQVHHPETPLRDIERDPAVVVAGLSPCTYHERAVAALACTRADMSLLQATVWATGVTDAYGFADTSTNRWRAVERAEPFTAPTRRVRDLARIRELADAYALARTKYLDVPLQYLIEDMPVFAVLKRATPRTRAIALASVALGRRGEMWDSGRAAMLIDDAEVAVITRVLSRARGARLL